MTLKKFILAAMPVVLLTACIRIDVTQTIDKTGKAQVEMLYDLSKLAEMTQDAAEGGELSIGAYGSVSSSSSSSDEFNCAAFHERQTEDPSAVPIKNPTCVDKAPNVILLSGTQQLRRSEFIRRKTGKKTIYIYKIQSANKLVQSQQKDLGSDPSVSPSGDDQMGKEMAEQILQGSFTVIMPGKITKAPGGVISGNRVTFKLTDFPLKRSGFIQSEE